MTHINHSKMPDWSDLYPTCKNNTCCIKNIRANLYFVLCLSKKKLVDMSRNKHLTKQFILPISGDAPAERIKTKIAMVPDAASRGRNQGPQVEIWKFQGFWCQWGQNSPFPINFARARAACDLCSVPLLFLLGCQYQCKWFTGKTHLWNNPCVDGDVKLY